MFDLIKSTFAIPHLQGAFNILDRVAHMCVRSKGIKPFTLYMHYVRQIQEKEMWYVFECWARAKAEYVRQRRIAA